MPLPFIRGFAEAAGAERRAGTEAETRRQQAAYESMLRRGERQIPQALPPAQIGALEAQAGLAGARAEAVPAQTAVAQQQAQTQEFQAKTKAFLDMTDPESGKPFLGLETQWHQLNSELLGRFSSAFQPGGQLAEGGGETPEDVEQIDLVREYVNNPTSANLKKIKQYYEPGVPRVEEKRPTKRQLLDDARDEAYRRLGGSYQVGLT